MHSYTGRQHTYTWAFVAGLCNTRVVSNASLSTLESRSSVHQAIMMSAQKGQPMLFMIKTDLCLLCPFKPCVQSDAAFARCLARFVKGNSEQDVQRRNKAFKLIPSVAEGGWMVRRAVGKAPVLIGSKLTTTYFR